MRVDLKQLMIWMCKTVLINNNQPNMLSSFRHNLNIILFNYIPIGTAIQQIQLYYHKNCNLVDIFTFPCKDSRYKFLKCR